MPDTESVPPQRRLVEYREGEDVFEAYVSGPQETAAAALPCVIVAHEWSGLNDSMRVVADRLAAEGYVAFALDVYGKNNRGGKDDDYSEQMGPLMADRALLRRRLLAAVECASDLEAVDPTRLAALGYCFGGLCALDLARAGTRGLLAAISVHGVFQPPALGPQDEIAASVLMLHGWEDPLALPEDVLAVTDELTKAKADWQLCAYGHARHAFTMEGALIPERGIVYEPKAARRSWTMILNFLDERLR